MRFSLLLVGAAALAVTITPVFAADYLGGVVKSTDINGQQVLTDANGMTLYIFDNDETGTSNCYDSCAEKWPPLFTDTDAKGEGDFSVVTRSDGTTMWAYKGKPLYYWIEDFEPGDINGDGVGGVWHLAIE